MAGCFEVLLYYTIKIFKIYFFKPMALDGALTTLSSYFFPAPFPTFFPTQLPCA